MMPYIKKSIRDKLDRSIDDLIHKMTTQIGEGRAGIVNYTISRLVSEIVHDDNSQEWSYVEITEVIAAFECAKLEFYRRVGSAKEGRAMIINGDLPAYRD